MTDIDDVVNEYVAKVNASMQTYASLAKNAGARLTDASPQPQTTWMDDVVTFWTTATQDAINLLAAQQKFAAQATKK
jgi:hypothetical protein